MSELRVKDFISPVGDAKVTWDGDKISSIEITIEGTMQSYRAKELQSRNRYCQERKIRAAGEVWFQKILTLGIRQELEQLQKQCGLAGVCIELAPIIYRKSKIRDFKDLVAGFDHMILDPLVAAGVLIDDDSGNLRWTPVQPEDYGGPKGSDYVALTFSPSKIPCRKSITLHILEFGWPDPKFRKIKKPMRREIIRGRLKHARS